MNSNASKRGANFISQNLFALIVTLLFIVYLFWVNNRHFITFNLKGPDTVLYTNAIWRTLHGYGFLNSSLSGRPTILSYHFSPFFALLSPLLFIWEDMRVLFLAQIIGFAATGLILYSLVSKKSKLAASLLLIGFFMNPTLHEIAIHEIRRITFAMPFLALAVYGLINKNWRVLFFASFIVIFVKEDMTLIVVSIGLFLLLFKEWRWGTFYVVFGLSFFLFLSTYLIPALSPNQTYKDLSYFSELGTTPVDILVTVLSNPRLVWQTMFDAESLVGLGKLLLPLAFVLPFLSGRWLIVGLPYLGILLLSNNPRMHGLQDWYLTPILPILYGAVIVFLNRQREKTAVNLTSLMLACSLIGFFWYSPVPPGGNAKLSDYNVTEHHRRAQEIVALVPDEAIVSTQAAFLPHFATRPQVYLYPNKETIDKEYYMFSTLLNPYPFDERALMFERENLVADPNNVVVAEVDNIHLIGTKDAQHPSLLLNAVAEGMIRLERAEIAIANEVGWYEPVATFPSDVNKGQAIRVTLYWEALDSMDVERTVSVRLIDAAGQLVGQLDKQPSDGARPTSWWEKGWYFRDNYYFSIADTATLGTAQLELVLYDSYTGERVAFESADTIHISDLTIK